MRSTAAARTVAGVAAVLSIAIFIQPVAADGIIYFTPSCSDANKAWLGTQLRRTIAVAKNIQDNLDGNVNEFGNGVGWFLQGDKDAARRLFKAEAGFTVSGNPATQAMPGDLIIYCDGDRLQQMEMKEVGKEFHRDAITEVTYPGLLPDLRSKSTSSVNMVYHWCEGRPDALTIAPWWLELMQESDVVNSVDAYVVPSLRGSLQKSQADRAFMTRWKFSEWQTWWNTKRGKATVVDMDVFQPVDLLFVGALAHTKKAGNIGVSGGTASLDPDATTFNWNDAINKFRPLENISYVYAAKFAFASFEGFEVNVKGNFTNLNPPKYDLLKDKKFPDLGDPSRYYQKTSY